MTMDPRVALNALTNALEEHLSASMNRRGNEDPSVESAFYNISDAFEAYEDALFAASGEVTPLDLYDEDDSGEDDSDDDGDDDDYDEEDDDEDAEDSEDDADGADESYEDDEER
ncbi:primosomal protein [Nesterenkonia sp. E16_7]|uniref:primosomal protein n=1 Tax=unclassified Nesterenkonia TaxID=2629769 RepID=UPI001A92A4B3|nr:MULTISPECIES: primosomal protein [unclassified Nesterenkonia]MBO0596316.1 primosomal protein [Nesterenkonia sp. E16_10]MBO0599729.1 primosomal protein [Nesterenkonia sp. E16_7]